MIILPRKSWTEFYYGLQQGLPKSQALRQAKLSFLTNNEGISPSKWAAFVLMGDNLPVKFKQQNRLLILGIILGLVIAVLAMFYFRRRQGRRLNQVD